MAKRETPKLKPIVLEEVDGALAEDVKAKLGAATLYQGPESIPAVTAVVQIEFQQNTIHHELISLPHAAFLRDKLNEILEASKRLKIQAIIE